MHPKLFLRQFLSQFPDFMLLYYHSQHTVLVSFLPSSETFSHYVYSFSFCVHPAPILQLHSRKCRRLHYNISKSRLNPHHVLATTL